MSEDILDKLALKNTENLSDIVMKNRTIESINKSNTLKINDDASNLERVEAESSVDKNNGIIDGTIHCKREEDLLKEDKSEDINLSDLPLFPNLSE